MKTLTISIGDTVSTKDGKIGIKKILFNPCPNTNPNYIMELNKCDITPETMDLIKIIDHNNKTISPNRLNAIIN
jgi:hypothetical protein